MCVTLPSIRSSTIDVPAFVVGLNITTTQGFSPNVDFSNVDWSSAPAIQDMPVISAFQYPTPGSVMYASEKIEAKGYAWAGGGRGIVRVDVSAVTPIVSQLCCSVKH